MSTSPSPSLDTAANLRLDLDHQPFVGRGRIDLLRLIGETGSISKAAKAMGMSYKHAWDAVDAMGFREDEG